MQRLIDWEEVWKKFDKWFDNLHVRYDGGWEAQQRKIERIVDKQVRKIIVAEKSEW